MDHYLSLHPDVFLAKKELHFFGTDLHFGRQFYRRDRDAYLTEFDAWAGQACVGESSVWYLFSQLAAAEIKAFNPQARIIIMLRDPAAMLYSMYHTFCCDGNEQLPTFEQALLAEDDRHAGRRISRQAYFPQGLVYRSIARYTEQVQRYFEVFGRERVHVIIYDEFAADTAQAYRETLNFLGVSSHPANGMGFGTINESQTARFPALRALLQDPLIRGTAIAWRTRLPPAIFAVIQKAGLQLSKLNSRAQKYPPIAPELQGSLQREFAPEVERLSALLGRDLTHWNKPEPAAGRQKLVYGSCEIQPQRGEAGV